MMLFSFDEWMLDRFIFIIELFVIGPKIVLEM